MHRIPRLCGRGNIIFAWAQWREVEEAEVIASGRRKLDHANHPAGMALKVQKDIRASDWIAKLIEHMTSNEGHRRETKNQIFCREFRSRYDRGRELLALLVIGGNEPALRSLQRIFSGLQVRKFKMAIFRGDHRDCLFAGFCV